MISLLCFTAEQVLGILGFFVFFYELLPSPFQAWALQHPEQNCAIIAKAANPCRRGEPCSCILENLKALSAQPCPALCSSKAPSGKRAFVCAFERHGENIPLLFFPICLFVCAAQEIKDDLFKVNDSVPMRGKHLSGSHRSPQLFLSLMGHFCLQRKQPL